MFISRTDTDSSIIDAALKIEAEADEKDFEIREIASKVIKVNEDFYNSLYKEVEKYLKDLKAHKKLEEKRIDEAFEIYIKDKTKKDLVKIVFKSNEIKDNVWVKQFEVDSQKEALEKLQKEFHELTKND